MNELNGVVTSCGGEAALEFNALESIVEKLKFNAEGREGVGAIRKMQTSLRGYYASQLELEQYNAWRDTYTIAEIARLNAWQSPVTFCDESVGIDETVNQRILNCLKRVEKIKNKFFRNVRANNLGIYITKSSRYARWANRLDSTIDIDNFVSSPYAHSDLLLTHLARKKFNAPKLRVSKMLPPHAGITDLPYSKGAWVVIGDNLCLVDKILNAPVGIEKRKICVLKVVTANGAEIIVKSEFNRFEPVERGEPVLLT